jgi:hypothetical protein
MTAGAFGRTLVLVMTTFTAHSDIKAVHGFLERDKVALFGTLEGVALDTGV